MNFTYLICLFLSLSAVASNIPQNVAQNIFKVVPINSYASVIPEKNAREIYQKECMYKLHTLTIDKRLNCETLKDCSGDECIRSYGLTGTGFLIEEGRTLMTAMHVMYVTHNLPLTMLSTTIESKGENFKRSALNNLEPEFILLNKNNKIVFDSRDRSAQKTTYKYWGDPLAISFQLKGSTPERAFGFFENAPYDYVGIQLPYSLGSGLKIKKKTRKNELSSFIGLGFIYEAAKENKLSISKLNKTSIKRLYDKAYHLLDFQKKPLDLDYDDFMELPVEEMLKRAGYSDDNIQWQIKEYSQSLLISSFKTVLNTQKRIMADMKLDMNSKVLAFDGEIAIGQSGGPIIDSNGDVIGVITNNLFNKYSGGVGVIVTPELIKTRDSYIND